MIALQAPLRLRLDSAHLVANWRWLAAQSGGAACGAAIKADGYGLGARAAMERLAAAGCRDFFVSNWNEAAALMPLLPGASLSVLHGVRDEDMAAARLLPARPVINSMAQAARWRALGEGRPCDVMVDTGINRLGVSPQDAANGALHGLVVDTLMSHLASADEESDQNALQLAAFQAVKAAIPAKRYSLANSAGICLGHDYAFDLTRPGLALYGGIPRSEAAGHIRYVATPQAQVLQIRNLGAGDRVGYNATFTATAAMRLAVINIGYADGYLRGFSGRGAAWWNRTRLPVVGRVSMDLVTLDVSAVPVLSEGDWIALDYDLPSASAQSGLSQYELLTGLGQRFERYWV